MNKSTLTNQQAQAISSNSPIPMQFTGTIQSWQDDRGFGFVEPAQGGQAVFVHIKSFTSRGGSRPQVGQRVTFEVELNHQGKKRAKNVAVVSAAAATSAAPRQRRAADSPAQWGGTASLYALPAFLLVYLAVAVIWRVPGWVAALYAGASVVCALVYAIDKSAAVAGRWRVSESTLHRLSLVGGWPGALVAQQVLRHKSNKAAFRAVFWATVVANVAGFVAIHSPLAADWRV